MVPRRRDTGLLEDSAARCVEICTVFRDVLVARVASLPPARVTEVDRALRLYLSLDQK